MTEIIFGPTPTELAYALSCAASADRFLDAYLAGRVTPEHVRELAIEISNLADTSCVISKADFQKRCDDLLEVEWKKAKFSRKAMRLILELPLEYSDAKAG